MSSSPSMTANTIIISVEMPIAEESVSEGYSAEPFGISAGSSGAVVISAGTAVGSAVGSGGGSASAAAKVKAIVDFSQ